MSTLPDRFTLTEGMPVVDDSGARGTVVALGPRWKDDPDWPAQNEEAIGEGLVVWRPGYGVTSAHGWTLDRSHPAAVGYLLAAVATAYDGSIYELTADDVSVVRTTGGVWSVWIHWHYGASKRVSTHLPSRIDALVSALEGAQ